MVLEVGREETLTFEVTMAESGKWAFESFCGKDSYVILEGPMDAYGNRLSMSDDDGGDGTNFRLEAALEAGVTYTLSSRWLDGGVSGTMPVWVYRV